MKITPTNDTSEMTHMLTRRSPLFWPKFYFIFGSLSIVFQISYSAPNTYQDFCLTATIAQNEHLQNTQEINQHRDKSLTTTIRTSAQDFYLIPNGNELVLKNATGNILQRIQAQRGSLYRVEDLKILPNHQLWIKGAERDYVAKIDTTHNPPVIGRPTEITTLKSTPCSHIKNFIFGCSPARSYYSPTLQKVFISGYEEDLFGGREPKAFIFDNDRPKQILPFIDTSAQATEAPELGGVIFRNQREQLIFHNGQIATILPLPESRNQKSTQINWVIQKSMPSRRIFIHNLGKRDQDQPLLFELATGLELIRIDETDLGTEKSWFEIFSLIDEGPLFFLSRESLWIYASNKLRKVASFPPTLLAQGLAENKRSEGQEIIFLAKTASKDVPERRVKMTLQPANKNPACKPLNTHSNSLILPN